MESKQSTKQNIKREIKIDAYEHGPLTYEQTIRLEQRRNLPRTISEEDYIQLMDEYCCGLH